MESGLDDDYPEGIFRGFGRSPEGDDVAFFEDPECGRVFAVCLDALGEEGMSVFHSPYSGNRLYLDCD